MRLVITGTIAILVSIYVDLPAQPTLAVVLGVGAFMFGAVLAVSQDIQEALR